MKILTLSPAEVFRLFHALDATYESLLECGYSSLDYEKIGAILSTVHEEMLIHFANGRSSFNSDTEITWLQRAAKVR